ncbi:PREDICTED: probable E3 ubiquitin-protein ligase RHC2A [Ipomoea nil]|uniref:probable E3 ubiquitin-protein ligase RHC2A n=1 Tax=Ipomoea nil TaxID=35883 RepID=UPI0009018EC7|nr:PREDICTED: probable E3 ubiquitin-protein ligase RHC2A [Ipomoea nil]
MDSLPLSLHNCSDTNPNSSSSPSHNSLLLGPANGFAPSGDNLRINLRLELHHHASNDDRNPLTADTNLRHSQASEFSAQSLQQGIKLDSSILEMDRGICCPICKDELFLDLEFKVLPCKHKFHANCISRWLKIKNSCPICRFQMPIKVDAGEFDRLGSVESEEFDDEEEEEEDDYEFPGAWHPPIRRVPRSYNLSAMFPVLF